MDEEIANICGMVLCSGVIIYKEGDRLSTTQAGHVVKIEIAD
jgi:hypothetical protein